MASFYIANTAITVLKYLALLGGRGIGSTSWMYEVGTGICYIHISGDGIWSLGQLWGSNNFIHNWRNLFFLPWVLNTDSYHYYHCCYQKCSSEKSSKWQSLNKCNSFVEVWSVKGNVGVAVQEEEIWEASFFKLWAIMATVLLTRQTIVFRGASTELGVLL